MKTILVIGAGFLQSFVIKRAKDMGYRVLAIDRNPKSVGFKYANEYGVIDIVDQEACLTYARSKGIDGIMTAATDYGVLSTAYVAENLNLPGLNYEVAKIIKNKYMVRKTLFENKVDDISQYYEVSSTDELLALSASIKFPVMVKPCDGSGSKGARKVETADELDSACTQAINNSLIGKALIEDFIEGKEYGIESFVYDGQVYVLGVMGKHMTSPPDYAELGHSVPSLLPNEEKVKKVARKAIKSLGINFGAVNMDVLVTHDGKVCIIDVGARMGGNLIGSHIIPIGTGVDYMGSLIRATVGDEVDFAVRDSRQNVVTRLLALRPGRVVSLPDFESIKTQHKVDIYHHLEEGKEIREYHNNLDGCGYVLAVADSLQEATRRAKNALSLIDLGIKRDT